MELWFTCQKELPVHSILNYFLIAFKFPSSSVGYDGIQKNSQYYIKKRALFQTLLFIIGNCSTFGIVDS